jgi:hypothetical protein
LHEKTTSPSRLSKKQEKRAALLGNSEVRKEAPAWTGWKETNRSGVRAMCLRDVKEKLALAAVGSAALGG